MDEGGREGVRGKPPGRGARGEAVAGRPSRGCALTGVYCIWAVGRQSVMRTRVVIYFLHRDTAAGDLTLFFCD